MSQFPFWGGQFGIPTMSTVLEGVENQPWFGKWEQQTWFPGAISGSARDTGNTDQTVLRPGLLLGRMHSGLLKQWDRTASDGSERIFGVLGATIKVTDSSGSNQDRYVGFVQIAGTVYSDRLIIPGSATEGIVGHTLEFEVESVMSSLFVLDRHVEFYRPGSLWTTIKALNNANQTLEERDRNILWTNSAYSANRTVTLPTPKPGLRFLFFGTTDHDIIINVTGNLNITTDGATATSYTINAGSFTKEFLELTGISTTEYLGTRHNKSEA